MSEINIKGLPVFQLPALVEGVDILRLEKEEQIAKELKLTSLSSIRLRDSCFDVREDAYSYEDLIYDEQVKVIFLKAKKKEQDRRLEEQRIKALLETYNSLSEEDKEKLLSVAKTFQSKAQSTPPSLPPVGGAYERFDHLANNWTKDRLRDFTGRVWGSWLKAFTPSLPADAISRTELMARDPALMRKLVRDFPADELATIIQTKTQRQNAEVTLVAIAAATGDRRALGQAAARIYKRAQRAKHQLANQDQAVQSDTANPSLE